MPIEGHEVPDALDVIANYSAAMAAGNVDAMARLRSDDYVLDWVHGDAFEDKPLTAAEATLFWPSWFGGFPEMDWQLTRTIAGDSVAVVQWTFTGIHSQPIHPPIFSEAIEPTGRTISFRGITVYDVGDGLLQRETVYIDLATIFVELGVDL